MLFAAVGPAFARAYEPPSPEQCRVLRGAKPPITRSLVVAKGLKATVTDRYGGYIPRNRLFAGFTVRFSRTDRHATVERAAYRLNGKLMRTDKTVDFDSGGTATSSYIKQSHSRYFPAGANTLAIEITPGEGTPQTLELRFTAGDCQVATLNFDATVPNARPSSSFDLLSGGPPLASAYLSRGHEVAIAIPAGSAGQKVGTMRFFDGNSWFNSGPPNYSARLPLKVPHSYGQGAVTLLHKGPLRVVLYPGRTRFLAITGLPEEVNAIEVAFSGHGRGLVSGKSKCSKLEFRASFHGGSGGSVQSPVGGVWPAC